MKFITKRRDAYMKKIGGGDTNAMVHAYDKFHHTDPNAQPGTNQRAIKAFQLHACSMSNKHQGRAYV